MTTYDTGPRSFSASDLRTVGLVPIAAGAVLGVGDLVAMTHLAYPWAMLANTSAVWAIAAFALGAALRTDPVRSAIAGIVMLLVAVEVYYAYAALIDLGELSMVWSQHAMMWCVFGVFAGAIFGAAGSWASGLVWWKQVVGVAAGAGVLIGEGLHSLVHIDMAYGTYRGDVTHVAATSIVLGILVLLVSSRRPSVFAAAAAATVPSALLCAAAFTAVGIAS